MALTLDGTAGITFPSGSGTQAAQSKVLQVVTATYATETSYSSSTLTDSNLTASITPLFSTSKILVLVSQNGLGKDSSNTYERVGLVRGSTFLVYALVQGGQTNSTAVNYGYGASLAYLDSPSTTSSVTYKTQIGSGANTGNVYAQLGGSTSTLTLMEIAV